MWNVYKCELDPNGGYIEDTTEDFEYKHERSARAKAARLVGEHTAEHGNWAINSYKNDAGHWRIIKDMKTKRAWAVSYYQF